MPSRRLLVRMRGGCSDESEDSVKGHSVQRQFSFFAGGQIFAFGDTFGDIVRANEDRVGGI